MKLKKFGSNKIWALGALFLFLLICSPAFMPFARKASAGTLTNTFVRFDHMTQSTPTTGTVCAKPATASTEAHVQVTFPTGYALGTAGNFTTTTTNLAWPAGGTAWLGIGTATNVTTQTVTFPSTDLVVGTLYCFNWDNTAAVQTKSSATNDNAGTVVTQDVTPSTIDSGAFATATVTSDSFNVTASINQTFQMSFAGGATDALGTLSTGSVNNNSAVTATVNTNAKNGWLAWAKDLNTGLNSSGASYTIASTGVGSASQALVAGTEGYNMGVAYAQTSGTCTAGSAVNGNFDKAGGSNKGGGLDTSLRTILTCGGTTNTGTITPTMFGAINGATAAASDYTDTVTVVAAGIF